MNMCDKVIEVVQGVCNIECITPEHSLQGDLALDSMQMVMLLLELEDVFQFELDESDMNPYDLNTVQDVLNLVQKYCDD